MIIAAIGNYRRAGYLNEVTADGGFTDNLYRGEPYPAHIDPFSVNQVRTYRILTNLAH